MALMDDIPQILEHVSKTQPVRKENQDIFEIWQGQLLDKVEADLCEQLSPQAFEQARHRISPINVLRKVTQKRSRIYSSPPTRAVINGTEQDANLLEFYERSLDIDVLMGQLANPFFNMHKWSNVELFVNDRMPKMRVNPADRILPFSSDQMDPTRPTAWIKFMGKEQKVIAVEGGELTEFVDVLWIVSDDEFLIIDSGGEVRHDLMQKLEVAERNPAGTAPFILINKDRFNLVPTPDSDTLSMSKLIPVLISDLNTAVMFQAFSIIYGIDVDIENPRFAPNGLWKIKSDPTSEQKPEIGMLKPQVDINEVIQFTQTQLAFWLDSMNIRPGTIGKLNRDNFASGVSKIIDEADTTEDRKQQIPFFRDAEKRLWEMVMHKLHPHWVETDQIDERKTFSPNAEIDIIFEDPKPVVDRSTILGDIERELRLGLLDPRRALERLNPTAGEDEIEQMLNDARAQSVVEV